MSDAKESPSGPDLTRGVARSELEKNAMLAGRVGEDEVLLVLSGGKIYAIAAQCSHYHAPLAEGLLVGDELRCPWHHACFDIKTGAATRAPALEPLSRWRVEEQGGLIIVREKIAEADTRPAPAAPGLESIVIIGGGAAGLAAALELRKAGYAGALTMLSDDPAPPVDRPNLSKDYLAGSAQADWLPLKPPAFYSSERVDLRLATKVVSIDRASRSVTTADGAAFSYDRLLLATGAEPVRLSVPGAELPHVFTLRTQGDCERIIARLDGAKRVVVIGASFIGLEVAAAMRARGLETHIVAPDKRPLERVLGARIGDFIRALHERHGVRFHLEDGVVSIDEKAVSLKSGATLEADLVVAGIGVRPRLELAQAAGLTIDNGVVVDARLATSDPAIFAAGDIARWPDPHSGAAIRVEHWVVAERQGQMAARNMLGAQERFAEAPFFWSQHHDTPINYVGHAERFDAIDIEGDVDAKDCVLRYKSEGRLLAVASIFRDLDSLREEWKMEQEVANR